MIKILKYIYVKLKIKIQKKTVSLLFKLNDSLSESDLNVPNF